MITGFDGKTITQIQELTELLQYYPAGETVEITVKIPATGGTYTEKTLSVTLGASESSNNTPTESGQQEDKNKSIYSYLLLTLRRIAISAEMCVRRSFFHFIICYLCSDFLLPYSSMQSSSGFFMQRCMASPVPDSQNIQYLPVGPPRILLKYMNPPRIPAPVNISRE